MRYAFLFLLNLPVILMAMLNILTQYKLKKISKRRFTHQFYFWLLVLLALLLSFPVYNSIHGKALLSSSQLSLIDITESTAIIYLVYIINNLRRKIEQNERFFRD
jgi:energy-coupling factor transporter transmembrane protein EcfT